MRCLTRELYRIGRCKRLSSPAPWQMPTAHAITTTPDDPQRARKPRDLIKHPPPNLQPRGGHPGGPWGSHLATPIL